MQLLVTGVLGSNRTVCLSFEGVDGVEVSTLKSRLARMEGGGVPVEEQVLTLAGRPLFDYQVIEAHEAEFLPPIRVSLRLLGGKGGFGSLLRGGPQGVAIKKTTNFDACRDLSGRRLRHANNEKLLQEWLAKEKDRDLQKVALDFIRKQQLTEKFRFDEEKMLAQSKVIVDSISSGMDHAVQQALALKRQKRNDGSSSASFASSSSSPLSPWATSKKGKEPTVGDSEELELDSDDDYEFIDFDALFRNLQQQTQSTPISSSPTSSSSSASSTTTSSLSSDSSTTSSFSSDSASSTLTTTTSSSSSSSCLLIPPPSPSDCSVLDDLLDLGKLKSEKELEELGLEKLKEQLMKRGMLCGGTLQERAKRLWSVRDKSLHEINPRLRAKPNNNKRRGRETK